MATSTMESTEKIRQLKLRGLIAREKTAQLNYDLSAEKINTQKSRLGVDTARLGLETARVKLEGVRVDLNIAQTELLAKRAGELGAKHRLGMVQDSTRALGAERQLKQRQLTAGLTSLNLSVVETQETNRLKLQEIKAAFAKSASLQVNG